VHYILETVSSPYAGIHLIDLGMKDELVKPWVAIASYFKRCTLFGWSGTGLVGLFRFLASLAISVCVLLLGVGVNTLGIPKERWYPNAGL